MPTPDPATGRLVVDPEISLKALGSRLDVSLNYVSLNPKNSVLGASRFANVLQNLVSYTDGTDHYVAITRGNLDQTVFQVTGSTYSARTSMTYSTLSYDSGNDKFTEYLSNGFKTVYATQVSSTTTYNIEHFEDPFGLRTTYSYDVVAGHPYLRSIQVPGGNRLTFNYSTEARRL